MLLRCYYDVLRFCIPNDVRRASNELTAKQGRGSLLSTGGFVKCISRTVQYAVPEGSSLACEREYHRMSRLHRRQLTSCSRGVGKLGSNECMVCILEEDGLRTQEGHLDALANVKRGQTSTVVPHMLQ